MEKEDWTPSPGRNGLFGCPRPWAPPLASPLALPPPPDALCRPSQALLRGLIVLTLLPARAFSPVHWVVDKCRAKETLLRWEPLTHPCSLPTPPRWGTVQPNRGWLPQDSARAAPGLRQAEPWLFLPWLGADRANEQLACSCPTQSPKTSTITSFTPTPLPNPLQRNECAPPSCTYRTLRFCDG